MPIKHVEINKIRENKAVVDFIAKLFDPHHTFAIRSGGIRLPWSAKMSLIFPTPITDCHESRIAQRGEKENAKPQQSVS
jgi:hypothetical protein